MISMSSPAYTGGTTRNPNYNNYAEDWSRRSGAGHLGPQQGDLQELLDAYWHHTDPTDAEVAVLDQGVQLSACCVLHGRSAAARSGSLEGRAREVRQIRPARRDSDRPQAEAFYKAEDNDQDYPRTTPTITRTTTLHRGAFSSSQVWGAERSPIPPRPRGAQGWVDEAPKDQLRKTLTPMQFDVTQRDGTEPPFRTSISTTRATGST